MKDILVGFGLAPRAAVFFSIAALCGCAATAPDDSGAVCDQAAAIVTDCQGIMPTMPPEGCVGAFRDTAQSIVDGGCDAVGVSGGKADANGIWCWPTNRWLGLCADNATLQEVAAITRLQDVCPSARRDALCEALRAGEDAAAALAVRNALAQDAGLIADAPIRYFLRERTLALLVYNVLTHRGAEAAEESGYRDAAAAVLGEHLPGYGADAFPMALRRRPPVDASDCAAPRAAILFFPGVMRVMNRAEFDEQAAAITEALPCVVTARVETGSFVSPTINAERGAKAVAALDAQYGPLPLHLIGYSQGSMNALTFLVDAGLSDRVKSLTTLNSAAHGSEVGDLLYAVLNQLDLGSGTFCGNLPSFMRPTCEWAALTSPAPDELLMDHIALAMGLGREDIEAFVRAEDAVQDAPTLKAFFARHRKGVRSLTTTQAEEFWTTRGAELPHHVLYQSMRSVISDKQANLPLSNVLFHALLERVDARNPFNDMQVRLENQHLGRDVANTEVVSPLFEGNHWQWAVADGAVSEAIMPRAMSARVPRRELLTAVFQTLWEVGLL